VVSASESATLDAAFEAILRKFPTANIKQNSGENPGFSWFHKPYNALTSFRFALIKTMVKSDDDRDIEGFGYLITVRGNEVRVNARYIEPLLEEFDAVLKEKGIQKILVTIDKQPAVDMENLDANKKINDTITIDDDRSPWEPFPKREVLNRVAEAIGEQTHMRPNLKFTNPHFVNRDSGKSDPRAKSLEIGLRLAFDNQKQKLQFIDTTSDLPESVLIQGSYDIIDEIGVLRVKAIKGNNGGETLAWSQLSFHTQEKQKEVLLGVFDFESNNLDPKQTQANNFMFRSIFLRNNRFEVIEGEDLNRVNIDILRKLTGCEGDQCKIIIGEQLGLDNIVFSVIADENEDNYQFTSHLYDVKTGQMVTSRKLKHHKKKTSFDASIEKIADLITCDILKTSAKIQFKYRGDCLLYRSK